MIVLEKIVTVRNKEYKLTVERGHDGSLFWNVYRMTGWGGCERIPAMSRSECTRFPKTVAGLAQALLSGYQTIK